MWYTLWSKIFIVYSQPAYVARPRTLNPPWLTPSVAIVQLFRRACAAEASSSRRHAVGCAQAVVEFPWARSSIRGQDHSAAPNRAIKSDPNAGWHGHE